MELARPPEEYILVLDSDMLIHKQFLPSDFKVAKGTAASENMCASSFLILELRILYCLIHLTDADCICKSDAHQRLHVAIRWYLEDLNTFLGRELLPDLAPKEDWDAYPGVGRVADQVGEFYFLHR